MPQQQASTSTSSAAGPLHCTVAHLLIEYLKAEGVRNIFGVPGGAVVWLMDELKNQSYEIDFVICRHESGATNALTGAMNAQAGNSSVLVITGEVPEKYFGQGYLQEGTDAKLGINVIYRNALQSSATVSNPLNAQTLFQQALRNACSLPPRAAHISLPNDVAGSCAQAAKPSQTWSSAWPSRS